ncbi:hypothetical protein BC443_11305 [Salinicola sp. MIT1003]|nr:hypothetical protein BC443_11305 [Salinicola sp. MIT1003]
MDDIHQTDGTGWCDDALPFDDLDLESRQDFMIDDGQVLLCGSRSPSSGNLAFPQRTVCQQTGARDMTPITFGPRGTLYSFATVHVSSSRKVPYTIGYVDFDNGLRVLAEVRAPDPQALACDIPVELDADKACWYVVPTNIGAAR